MSPPRSRWVHLRFRCSRDFGSLTGGDGSRLARMTVLLVRDLVQVVSPAGSGAPLRGPRLREISVTADAYVLCEDGRISEVGRMAELPTLGNDVEELDGRG